MASRKLLQEPGSHHLIEGRMATPAPVAGLEPVLPPGLYFYRDLVAWGPLVSQRGTPVSAGILIRDSGLVS